MVPNLRWFFEDNKLGTLEELRLDILFLFKADIHASFIMNNFLFKGLIKALSVMIIILSQYLFCLMTVCLFKFLLLFHLGRHLLRIMKNTRLPRWPEVTTK
jgi:hypothetical protein